MKTWNQELLQSLTHVSSLLEKNLITPAEAEQLEALGERFQVRITPYYASLMSADPHCPIRKQALPDLGEKDPELPHWATQLSQEIYQRATPWHPDAIGDVQNLSAPRITHRYGNRAILHVSPFCAVYCRFCFRKSHLNAKEESLYDGSFQPALNYLSGHSEIHELILTGGDPLSLTDSAIERLLAQLSQIPHIRIVRFHSRMPVTLPQRFTSSLLAILSRAYSFQIVLAAHFNHPRELTGEARKSLKELRKAGVLLLNQSVLLKGVNAATKCLATLFQELYEIGVIPFYLHHPDWTPGTFQFRLSIEKGKELVRQLQGLLPGPAIPRYVLDIPQGYGKTSILDADFVKVRDYPGPETHGTGGNGGIARSMTNEGSEASPAAIQGALYQVVSPSTRKANQRTKHLYLDLFSCP